MSVHTARKRTPGRRRCRWAGPAMAKTDPSPPPVARRPAPQGAARGRRGGGVPRARTVERQCRAWELSLEGQSQRQIARALGVSQPAVSHMLREAEARAFAALVDVEGRLHRRLVLRLDFLYRQNVAGWQASRGERTTKRHRRSDGTGTGRRAARRKKRPCRSPRVIPAFWRTPDGTWRRCRRCRCHRRPSPALSRRRSISISVRKRNCCCCGT